MADNLSGLGIVELRKMLRAKHPQCRGSFAGSATKEEVLDVLEGRTGPDEALVLYFQKKVGAVGAVGAPARTGTGISPPAAEAMDADVQGDAPPEGVGGENPPAGAGKHFPADAGGNLGKILSAVKTLYPVAAKELEALIEQSNEKKSFDKSTSMIATDGKVKIGGIDVPVILDGPGKPDPVESMSCPDHPDAIMQRVGQDKAECAVCGRRGIVGPETARNPNWAYVPVADPNYRFDYWRAERNIGAVKFRQEISDFIKLLRADFRIMLVGPPSCGKTSVPEQYAARCGHPVTRFNGNRDVTISDFVGCYEAHDGATEWVDGPLVRAMKEGHILILDEVDHMPAECSSALHSVLEPGGKLVITGHGGEVVESHPNFRIVATANTAGFGDDSGLHPNAQVQDAAFLSRFDCVFRVSWLSPGHEKSLLVKQGVNSDTAKLMVKVANDTRKAVEQGDLLYPVTLRQTMGWAAMSGLLDVATAFALSVLNKIPESDVAAVSEIAQRHFGNSIGGV